MNRPSEFDKEVRKKMLLLEDEPSAAVWAGIRAETGLPLQSEKGIWAYRIMAAASVAFLIAMAIFMGRNPEMPSDSIAKVEGNTTTQPQLPKVQEPTYATDNEREIPASNEKLPWYDSPEISVENILAEEAPKDLAPTPEEKLVPLPQPKEILVDRSVNPVEKAPELSPQVSPDEASMEVLAENTQESESQGNKRVFRLPRPEDLNKDNLRKRSRGLLGAVANGAKDYLGIDTKFNEKEEQNLRTTAFSANLGFFKVRKVRTVKTNKK